MKRVKKRARAALLLTLLVGVGMIIFLARLITSGDSWATYRANESVYTNGVLDCGTLTDRNGVVLAEAGNGSYRYAEDDALRLASLHAVGDYTGFIGSGALSVFADLLTDYSLLTGTTGGGETVALSLDAELQKSAWQALGGRSGAVLVINYQTGEILCMVSSPAYDPYGAADESVEGVYLNRCTSALYTPGSVYKLVTLVAALETLPDLMEQSFRCEQSLLVGGDYVNCTGWHGDQTIEQALANSCNCAFAELALELGSETLAATAKKLGVSGALKLDGRITTASGRFDTAEAGTSNEAWSGIGQYNDLVTPYAMARLCAAIANGGVAKEPTLLLEGDNGETRLMTAEAAQALGDMMNYDVVYAYGRDRFPGLDLCAKSGTAELGDGATHAWFVGYLQSGAPVAFAVALERGGGGLLQAGAVANTVLQKALEIYGQ